MREFFSPPPISHYLQKSSRIPRSKKTKNGKILSIFFLISRACPTIRSSILYHISFHAALERILYVKCDPSILHISMKKSRIGRKARETESESKARNEGCISRCRGRGMNRERKEERDTWKHQSFIGNISSTGLSLNSDFLCIQTVFEVRNLQASSTIVQKVQRLVAHISYERVKVSLWLFNKCWPICQCLKMFNPFMLTREQVKQRRLLLQHRRALCSDIKKGWHAEWAKKFNTKHKKTFCQWKNERHEKKIEFKTSGKKSLKDQSFFFRYSSLNIETAIIHINRETVSRTHQTLSHGEATGVFFFWLF